MNEKNLYQPILSKLPEPGHTQPALSLNEMLVLLKKEEDYWIGEEFSELTKTVIVLTLTNCYQLLIKILYHCTIVPLYHCIIE